MHNVGLQLWSVRESVAKDLLGTLEKVREMGYTAVQFAGFSGLSAEEVKQKLSALDLRVAGAHLQGDFLNDSLDDLMKFHETINNRLLIVPWLPEELRKTEDDYKRIAEQLNEWGKTLHENGFTLGYHNHDFEFEVFNGKTGLDILFENTDPNHLKMELDCFWAAYTDNDPIEVIEKHKDRCISLHIKDLIMENNSPVSTELDTGNLPLLDYMKKGMEVGCQWFIVEQEHFKKDPLVSAKENSDVMKKFSSSLL